MWSHCACKCQPRNSSVGLRHLSLLKSSEANHRADPYFAVSAHITSKTLTQRPFHGLPSSSSHGFFSRNSTLCPQGLETVWQTDRLTHPVRAVLKSDLYTLSYPWCVTWPHCWNTEVLISYLRYDTKAAGKPLALWKWCGLERPGPRANLVRSCWSGSCRISLKQRPCAFQVRWKGLSVSVGCNGLKYFTPDLLAAGEFTVQRLLTQSCSYSVFIGHLLYTRHHAKCWGKTGSDVQLEL